MAAATHSKITWVTAGQPPAGAVVGDYWRHGNFRRRLTDDGWEKIGAEGDDSQYADMTDKDLDREALNLERQLAETPWWRRRRKNRILDAQIELAVEQRRRDMMDRLHQRMFGGG